jgi:hypothetical protein
MSKDLVELAINDRLAAADKPDVRAFISILMKLMMTESEYQKNSWLTLLSEFCIGMTSIAFPRETYIFETGTGAKKEIGHEAV